MRVSNKIIHALTITCVLMCINLITMAQEQVIAYKAGTAVIENGSVVIKLNESIKANEYYVILTPIGNSTTFLKNKKDGEFTISSPLGENVPNGTQIDYIIFEKTSLAAEQMSLERTTQLKPKN